MISTVLFIKDQPIGCFVVGSSCKDNLEILNETKIINLLAGNLEAAFKDSIDTIEGNLISTNSENTIKKIQVENELLQHYKTLLFDNISDGIIIFNLDGLIIDCNAAMEQMIKYNKTHLINTRFRNYVHPEDSFIGEEIRNCSFNGQQYLGQIRLITSEKTILYCEIKIRAFCSSSSKDFIGILSILREIPQQIQ
jgi:PAS domain S-box-containing protein